MTLYIPVHHNGSRALPCDSMTAANLFIFQQSEPRDWRVELVKVEEAK